MGAGRMWARSERRRRRGAALALILLIGVSGAVVLSTLAGARRTATAFDRFLDASDAADVQLQYSSDGAVDDKLLAALRASPDIERAAPVYMTVGFSQHSDYDLGIFAGPDPALFRDIDRARVLEGRLPDPAAADEILISRFIQHNLGVKVGDTVQLGTFSAEQFGGDGPSGEPAGPVLDMRVVGVGVTPYDVADPEFGGVFSTPAYFAAHWGEVGGYGPTIEIATRGPRDPAAVVKEAISGFKLDEVILAEASDLTVTVDGGTSVLATGLTVFAVVAGLASLVACAQALHRRIADAGRDQASLRAMGLTRVQRCSAIGQSVAPVVGAGTALAVLLAVPASVFMPIGDARRAEPHPGVDVDLRVLAPGALALLGLLGLVVALSAWRVARRDVRAPGDAGTQQRLAPGRLLRNRLSPPADLGVSMALDRGVGAAVLPVRSALVGAAVGAAGIVAVLTFGASLDALVSTPARSGWNWTFAPDLADEADMATLLAIPGVDAVGRLHLNKLVIDGDQVQGVAVQSEKGSPALTVLRGRMPTGPREIAVGPALADRSDLHLGDAVMALDHAAGRTREMVVVGEVLLPTFDDNPFNDGAVVAPTVIDDLADSSGFEQAVVTFDPAVSTAEARHRMTEALPESMSVYASPSLPPDVAHLAAVRFLPRLLGGFLGLLALAAVGNALATSLRRRRRDLGIVRSLGFVGRDVALTIAAQSLTLVAVGLLVGMPLGVAVGRVAWRIVADGIGVSSQPTLPPVALATLSVAALVVGGLLAAFPGHIAARLRTVETLRAE